jgi:hypothetical protein
MDLKMSCELGKNKHTPGARMLDTHCARRPACVMVTMILSLNEIDVTSVTMPLISPAACFVCAG